MATAPKPHTSQDSFLDTLRSEVVAGTENLTSWLNHIHANKGSDPLFELETWLRGLCSFFNLEHLSLTDPERADLVNRSFAPEIRIVREIVQVCERITNDITALGQPQTQQFEAFIESQMRKDSVLDYHVSKILEQPTPLDSLARMLESLNDIKVLANAMKGPQEQSYQLFLSLGRTFTRDLRNCRYVDMLLTQRFKLHFDRIDNSALTAILRGIAEENIRQNVSIALLYLYRFLRYLKLVSRDLIQDRNPRRCLVIFSLLHEEMQNLSNFLKSRFLTGRSSGHGLWKAAELIVYSLKMESQRTLHRELVTVSQETAAPLIHGKIDAGHGLLQNCYQNCIVTLVQAFDKNFDLKMIFPHLVDQLQETQTLLQDLWALRQYLKDVLEKKEEFDLDKIVARVNQFRESSLRFLMYRDWGEFERFADAIVNASNRIELRTLLRKLVSFLETLVQEVSKRSIIQKTQASVVPKEL